MNETIEQRAARMIGNVDQGALAEFVAAAEPSGDRYRHVRRGTEYTVIGRGIAQGFINDDDPVVLYRGDDGQVWVRHEREFNDGRFERIGDAS